MTEIGLARRPPAPMPRAGALGPIGLYRALRRNGVEAWREEAFEEPYVADRNQLGGFVLLNDPDLIRYVLIDNAANYPKDDLQLEKLTPAVGRGLLTADGESWRLQRRTVAALFQPQAVAAYIAPMQVSVDAMLTRWAAHARRGETIDIAREMTALTYDIISRTVFSNEIETPPDVMGEAITTYFEALGRIDLWDVLPLPRWLPRPAFIRARPAQKIFRDEVLRLFEQRRARMVARQAVPDDLVTRLINARDPETGAPLSDSVIHDNLVTFIGAGHETTANALAWTLFLMSQFGDADARVAREAAVLPDTPDADALGRLADTRMILEESMRLYPPVPFLSRAAAARDMIGEVAVVAGTRIIIAPWVLHRHRKLWRDPDMFVPERFAPERRGAIPRFGYLPFGAGARICVGMTFAMNEALLALSLIARRFRVTLGAGAQVMPFARMTLRPLNGLPMRIEARR
ncbi:MAG: cytochrome P450 [Alphaproteobacteria bacterium]|nr:cytochrome P450 [Alphaproteobacteria bacterium]